MDKKTRNLIIICIILLLILLVILGLYFMPAEWVQSENQEEVVEPDYTSTELEIKYEEDEISGEWEETAKILLEDNATKIEGSGASVSGNTVTIKSAGTYYITGTLTNGNIVVDAGDKAEVQLVLAGVDIKSQTTSAINGVKAAKLTITLEKNTNNKIEDASTYTTFTDTEDQEPDAAIFTKTDLVINGEGSLQVTANYQDGIASKDTLKIMSGNIEVKAADDGIRGKDYVAIYDGNIQIDAKGDGIKSTNTSDASLGYIVIEGGKITIQAENDGIQAETVLNIKNADITITTNGKIETKTNSYGFGRQSTTSNTTDSVSSKGIKAGNEITIESGTLKINSTDDSIHSNGNIIIKNGTMDLASGDDGIHADTNIYMIDGSITITKSYEGIESNNIQIDGGKISVVASDDGINVSGGKDSSSMQGRPGQNNFSNIESSNRKLVITGGEIEVRAEGDGLDSNGSIQMSGGTVVVAGPTSGGNGILDYDGTFEITGGVLIGYGSSDMLQTPSTTSSQYSIVVVASGKSGDTIKLQDSNGKDLVNMETVKSYSAVIISSPDIQKGESYELLQNGNKVSTMTVNSVVTSSGNVSGGYQNGGMGGKKGGRY